MINILWWVLRVAGILAALFTIFALYCCLVVGGREDEEMERRRRFGIDAQTTAPSDDGRGV